MKKLRKGAVTVILFALAGLFISPVLFMAAGSLMGKQELRELLGPAVSGSSGYVGWRLLPGYPTLRSYVELLLDTPEFFIMFWNSVKLTGGILAGQCLVGIPAAWAFAKETFPFKRLLFAVYIILMMMPFQVTMLGNYLVLDRLGLLDTMAGVILPGIFSTFPVFIMYRYFAGIPDALLEAARLDGAGELRIFFMLGFPLGSPGIISAMVLGFLEYWNLIEQPMAFLKTKKLWPLSLLLPDISMEQAGLAFAASVTAMLPAVLVFLAGQDYLEQGILSAGMKE